MIVSSLRGSVKQGGACMKSPAVRLTVRYSEKDAGALPPGRTAPPPHLLLNPSLPRPQSAVLASPAGPSAVPSPLRPGQPSGSAPAERCLHLLHSSPSL
ncbi:unnamed protein product [Rangifer tarandus platyrhynchus]|uniref:Uncharacterized protein n=1 Tax=Rangifer tarandus platyrhynchus TaxID=3082113 RepID=A0AC59YEC3_RANTA